MCERDFSAGRPWPEEARADVHAFEALRRENAVLSRELAAIQSRVTQQIAEQSSCIAAQQAELMRLRGRLMARDTLIARLREEVLRPDPDLDLHTHLAAADLVICQVGCISHGAYWRVKDHCRRTGKRCVLVGRSSVSGQVHSVGEVSQIEDT